FAADQAARYPERLLEMCAAAAVLQADRPLRPRSGVRPHETVELANVIHAVTRMYPRLLSVAAYLVAPPTRRTVDGVLSALEAAAHAGFPLALDILVPDE